MKIGVVGMWHFENFDFSGNFNFLKRKVFFENFEFLEKFGLLEKNRLFLILKFLKNVSYQDCT